jgi:hypothetical protein
MKALSLVLALLFLIVGILYFAGMVHWPSFLVPRAHGNGHGIACILLALLCLVWFRFQSAQPAR